MKIIGNSKLEFGGKSEFLYVLKLFLFRWNLIYKIILNFLGFQLAIDLNDYDLFIDVHHAAKKRGLVDLAQVKLSDFLLLSKQINFVLGCTD